MSDRVAFIGGKTAGRDHFPWATYDIFTPAEAGDLYSKGITFESAMKWVWRVKKWELSGTIDFDVNSPAEGMGSLHCEILNTTLASAYRFNPPGAAVAITRESELVLGPLFNVVPPVDYTIVNPFPGVTADPVLTDMAVNLLADDAYPLIYYGGDGLFYPIIDLNWVINGDDNWDGYQVVGASSRFSVDSSNRITIDGYNVGYGIGFAGSAVEASIAVALTLSPKEFWPYATKSGVPVYDTATGAQLADPLS